MYRYQDEYLNDYLEFWASPARIDDVLEETDNDDN